MTGLPGEGLAALVLAFVRIAALLGMLPVWSTAAAPRWVAPLCALGCAALVAPGLSVQGVDGVGGLLAATFGELVLGSVAGLVVRVSFTALTLAAELAGQQAGFGFATMFDPFTHAQESPFGTLAGVLGTATFLSMGLHLELLGAIAHSFEAWPLGATPTVGVAFVTFVGTGIALGGQMAGPVVVGGLLLQLFLGLLTKTAPKMNAFFSVGPVLTSMLGVAIFAASLPWMLAVWRAAAETTVHRAVVLLGGG